MRTLTQQQLVDAVQRGIISPAQYDALIAMEPNAPPHFGVGGGIMDAAAIAEMGAGREPPRGFNWITITYYLGALTVMFAFGWFLVDRWEALGAGGILAVTGIYAALFVATGEYLRRQGFRVAGGLITGVAVGMTPLIVWAAQDVLGFWPSATGGAPREPFDGLFDQFSRREAGNWIVVEIATIAVALLAFRRLRFAFLLAPPAIAFLFVPRHVVELLVGALLGRFSEAWIMMATGVGLLTIAYAIDRRDGDRSDYAYWPYLVGMFVTAFGITELWDRYPAVRHLLPVVALLFIAASLTLRRVLFLAFGGVMLYAYLGWLAFDLFRSSAMFPIVLATLGLIVILGAVWIQRAYPRMVTRVNAGLADPRPWLPAGYVTPVVVTLFAMAMTILSLPSDRDYRRRMDEQNRRNMEAYEAQQRREGESSPDTSRPPRDTGSTQGPGR